MNEPKPRLIAVPKEIGVTSGIVKTPGVDDVLAAVEAEEEIVNQNQRLLEGTPQTGEQMGWWRFLLNDIQAECNKRLVPHGVFIAAAVANPNGLGAVFVGADKAERVYTITLTYPARERDDFNHASKESFVRWVIDQVVSATLEQRRIYLHRAGLS